MIIIAITRFKEFIKLVGPDESRNKSGVAPHCDTTSLFSKILGTGHDYSRKSRYSLIVQYQRQRGRYLTK